MKLTEICFSVHDYDQDGDVYEEGVYLHFGGTRVKVADSIEEFELVAKRISGMVTEIKESYGNCGA